MQDELEKQFAAGALFSRHPEMKGELVHVVVAKCQEGGSRGRFCWKDFR